MTEPLAPGRVLGARYRLVRPIARGGMASVWEAEDPLLSRRVAVKILDAQLGTDDALRARFRHEAVAAARLAHPNIVSTYDTGEDDGVAYIVMELIDGLTLRELLDSHGALPVGEAVDITMQVAAALTHAHEHDLVHRDVKPGNVLVQRDGHVKVTDFGIAKATDQGSELTRAGAVMGTARYLAPEQLQDGTVDARADVYSLALVLYELLVGRPPFAADSDVATAVARLTADAPAVSAVRPDVPAGLDAVLARALMRDPAARTLSARAFREELSPYRGRGGEAALIDATRPVMIPRQPPHLTTSGRGAAPPPPSAATRSGSGTALRILGTVLLFALGVGIGYLGFKALDGSTTTTTTTTTTVPAVPLTVTQVEALDPSPGDGRENSDDVANIADDDPATTWSTESYVTPALGGKGGVGLQFALDAAQPVSALDVEVETGPWNASLYVSDEPFEATPADTPATTGTDLGTTTRLEVNPPTTARYVLLWITSLPESGTGDTPYRLTITGARVLGG
ncbi:MAG: protein kinase domain-containing protein [Acidimicrobiia bacterium]